VSFTFDDFVNPTWINVKECSNSVLKFSRPKHLPHLDRIIESEPTARLSCAIHVIFLSENAIQGLT
jgi:hypothetical protein